MGWEARCQHTDGGHTSVRRARWTTLRGPACAPGKGLAASSAASRPPRGAVIATSSSNTKANCAPVLAMCWYSCEAGEEAGGVQGGTSPASPDIRADDPAAISTCDCQGRPG